MRMVYLSPVGVMGGAEQCLLQVMSAVLREEPRAEVTLIAAADGELLRRAEGIGASVRVLPMPPEMAELGDSILNRNRGIGALLSLGSRAAAVLPATRRYWLALAAAVREIDPQLIHSNGLKMHLLSSLARLPGNKTVWHLHDFLGARPAMGRALRWASRRAAGAIAISNAVATDARAVLPGLPIEVVYNAIDVGHFCPAPPESPVDGGSLDALAGLPRAPAGTLRVGMVATFARWKGQEILLEAAARLVRERPAAPIRFYVIGGPIYQTQGSQFSEQDLRDKADSLGIISQTGFIGFQRDPRDIYRALDVVVHASTQPEPFGLTIVEAMACGRAVIVTGSGGAAELFTPDTDAVGIGPGDPAALAGAIASLLDEPDRRASLGQNARRTAAERFSRDRLGKQMLSHYAAFISRGAARRTDQSPLPSPSAARL